VPRLTPETRRTAVAGAIGLCMGIAVASAGIVHAELFNPDSQKTFSCNSGTACLSGIATGSNNTAVSGSSSGNGTHGVYGTSTWAGVTGYTSATDGVGVFGQTTVSSGSAHGVYGKSSNGPGVYGTSSVTYGASGYLHKSLNQSGAYGESKADGNGVVGESNDSSGENYAVAGVGEHANTQLFNAYNDANKVGCTIDANADLTCAGGVSGSVLRATHYNSARERVFSYVSESASAMIEDFGTGRMVNGTATVRIDPAFSSVIDRARYYVSLTPLGDTRGLYVSAKGPSTFQVRESERGRDTAAFDYRIVAHPSDISNDRLPLAPPRRRPPPQKFRHIEGP
jgi:hypothetical protein